MTSWDDWLAAHPPPDLRRATPPAPVAPVVDDFEAAGAKPSRAAASAPIVATAKTRAPSAMPDLTAVAEEDRVAYSAGYWTAFGHRYGIDPDPPF